MRDDGLYFVRGRDEAFAAAMARAEAAADPTPREDPLDAVGRTRAGLVVRRNGQYFAAGPFLDASTLPLVD